ncbi:unnamed protein product [Blepharisma stoltei]|uniref:Uncharacterized protein n=1 Tax=Blepharisma stoltei TaxID=1481888 RepID=A0AAU9IWJ1_9CILI|nr:unnamed protein product [Blepharisma stoltei]
MLCIGDRKAYLIDNEYGIFESGADNEYIWNKISMYQTDYFSKGVNANCENSVYYSTMEDHTMSIYKFYLDEKRLYEIKNV